MKSRPHTLLIGLGFLVLATAVGNAGAEDDPVMPSYDENGRLLRPAGYPTWILAGSSLGLGYDEDSSGNELFHHVLIEPSAYRHFADTGEFREGTMLALLLHDVGSGVVPAREGRFADGVRAVELAVKDSSRVEESWAYYNFTEPNGLLESARAFPKQSCHSCHVEHAARDNVFLQFYSLLAAVDPSQ